MGQMLVTLVPRNTLNVHILVPLAATISDIRAGVCAQLFVGCRPDDTTVHDFANCSLLDDAAWDQYVGFAAPHLRVSCCGPMDSSAFLYHYDRVNGLPMADPILTRYDGTLDQFVSAFSMLSLALAAFVLNITHAGVSPPPRRSGRQ